jgi:hypothetical protein
MRSRQLGSVMQYFLALLQSQIKCSVIFDQGGRELFRKLLAR